MDDMNIFCVKYPDGEMKVNISNFFGTADLQKVKKFLKLASKYCSVEQREVLLKALNRGIRRRKEAIDSLEILEMQKINIAAPFLEYKPIPSVSEVEKILEKQRTRIARSIEILEEVWPL